MAEHWCKEHQTVWFKKGKMKGFAHPVLNENGEETGQWCNEPEGKAPEPNDDMTKEDWANKDRIRAESIEIQNAYTGVPALVETIEKYPNDQLLKTAYNYAMSKLSNWSSMGEASSKSQETELLTVKPATREQRQKLSALLKNWDAEEAKELLIDRFKTNETKHLNYEQMEDFLVQLEKGAPKELTPEDIPF